MRLAERPAEHGEVLGEDVHRSPLDAPIPGHHTVAGHDLTVEPEVGGTVGDEPVELDEAALVQHEVQPLARGQLALLVLLGDARGAPALLRERLAMM
jgi:hypothetical protein